MARWLILVALLLVAAPSLSEQPFRRGTSAQELTNTPQVLLRPVPNRTITHCVILGGAANQQVIFRGVGGTPTYATVNVAAGATLARTLNAAIPVGGLEVITTAPAGDVSVECLYRVSQ